MQSSRAVRAARNCGSAARPAKRAFAPSASSIRSTSFHFAIRSDRANEPTLSCPASQPTARCAIETSSVSPDRADTIVPHCTRLPASSAARASVTVPAWFGFTSTALHAPRAAAAATRAAFVTRKSSPMTCTRSPTARVNRASPSPSSSASGSSIETIG